MAAPLLKRLIYDANEGSYDNDPINYSILAAASAVAWIYAIELNLTIFLKFCHRGGIYFWSLLICSWGIAIHALAFILKYFVGVNWIFGTLLVVIGWVMMVTGQAVVLYSRLHLVTRNQKLLRFVLIMIVFDAFALHVPTMVFVFGANSPSASHIWSPKFDIMERVQLAVFSVQESIISAIYVWATVKLLNSISHHKTRTVMVQLIIINVACISMDIILVILEYTNKYMAEASVKAMLYAIKLKIEFVVLNQLMELISSGLASTGTVHNWPGRKGSGVKDDHRWNNSTIDNQHDAAIAQERSRAGSVGYKGYMSNSKSWGWSQNPATTQRHNIHKQSRQIEVATDIQVEHELQDQPNARSSHGSNDQQSKESDTPLTGYAEGFQESKV